MKYGVSAVATAVLALVIAGCGTTRTVTKTVTTPSASASASSAGMAGMDMGSSTAGTSGSASTTADATSVPSVNGIKPVASQLLATAKWQDMTIEARTMTPIPFYVDTGSGSMQEVKPTKKTSFHLMIMLSDEHTGEPIPYASVWATITKDGKTFYNDRQWPMLSEYMGPHYGNNVTLPGAGHYELKLLISPPVAARHVEYKDVWTSPHTVTVGFNWKPTS